jgi:2-polyprenyl-6-methoxyphenol hydroxylase-like FAD-dependent oxidoreductase
MWFSPVGWGCRFRSDLMTYACSRDLLEWGVRRRVATYGGVRFLQACDVIDLLPNSNKTGVAGVRMRPRDRTGAEPAGTADLSADLVIDASGRSSRAPHWLEALSYMPPAETTINSFLGYATCIYARPPGMPVDWKALLIQARPPVSARGGGLYPLEGDRWVVTLAGAARDYPPIDEAGFLEFARTLASPLLYEAIKDAEPLSPIYGYQRTENRLCHYERLTRWPEGFVVLGDAVCAFNPVYGQGMTAAAQAALLLEHCLRAQRQRNAEVRGMARHFQRQLARINTVPWLLATGEDFRYPATEGGQPNRITRLMHRYIDRVMLCAVEHPDVFTAFLEVAHLLKPPAVLLRPDILARVLVDAFEPIVNLRTAAFKKLRSRV